MIAAHPPMIARTARTTTSARAATNGFATRMSPKMMLTIPRIPAPQPAPPSPRASWTAPMITLHTNDDGKECREEDCAVKRVGQDQDAGEDTEDADKHLPPEVCPVRIEACQDEDTINQPIYAEEYDKDAKRPDWVHQEQDTEDEGDDALEQHEPPGQGSRSRETGRADAECCVHHNATTGQEVWSRYINICLPPAAGARMENSR